MSYPARRLDNLHHLIRRHGEPRALLEEYGEAALRILERVGQRWLLGSGQLDFAIYRQTAPSDGFAGFAPVRWIDWSKWPGRHRSDARPLRLLCESSHEPPATAPIIWPMPHQVSPWVQAGAAPQGDRRTCGRSAPGAKAAESQAGPDPQPGRRPADAARVVAGLAVPVPVPTGIAGRSAGIPATIVTAVSRDVSALGRRVVARGARVGVPRLAVARVGPASPAPVARLRGRRPQDDQHRGDQQTSLQVAGHDVFSRGTACARAETTLSLCNATSHKSRRHQPNLPHPQSLGSRSKQASTSLVSSMLLVVMILRTRFQHKEPRRTGPVSGARRLAPDSTSVHHAFMNQKIMPISATRSLVTGVGKPARKYQSFPRCVRMPGVSVMLVWSLLLREVFTTVER